jgi:hypothetical protein
VSGAHLNALLRDLEEAGLSAASRRQTYAVLSRAFRDAVRWGRLVRTVALDAVTLDALAEHRDAQLLERARSPATRTSTGTPSSATRSATRSTRNG